MVVVHVDTAAVQQSAAIYNDARWLYGVRYAQRISDACADTIRLLRQQPNTAGYQASPAKRRQLGVAFGVPLLVCDKYAPIRAVYQIENNRHQIDLTILEFEETMWPTWLMPLPRTPPTP
jgi:hypothetical protein